MRSTSWTFIFSLCFFISACNETGGPSGKSAGTDTQSSGNPDLTEGQGTGEPGSINGPGGDGTDGGSFSNLVSDQFIQANYTEDYDFLWVVDNSGSMSDIRAFMMQNLDNFVSVLQSRRSLAWQMAVTITDALDFGGNLVTATSGARVVTSQMANAGTVWTSILSRITNTNHSFWEQGLESGYLAIQNYASEFSRSNVPLIVAYVSDEQDFSCQANCHNYASLPEGYSDVVYHPLTRYRDQFAQIKNSRGTDVIVHPVIHLSPVGNNVPGACDTVGSIGARYRDLEILWNSIGDSHSLCANDLAASFNSIAQLTANRGVCFNLRYTLANMQNFEVRVDGTLIPASLQNGYAYEAANNSVCFSGTYVPHNGSTIDVTYRRVMF